MTAWGLVAAAMSLAAFALSGAHGCVAPERWPGPKGAPPAEPQVVPASVAADDAGFARGAHPRILLTPDRLATVREARARGTASWRKLADRCDEVAAAPIDAGYEAWDWANAALDLALCASVTSRSDFARAGVTYLRALLDDRFKVGDAAGGDDVVHHDDGYPIRTRGCFGAIAYDWLHDAPGMTDELRAHARDRFAAWNAWFATSGYSRDQPIANYYVGWFGAVAFAALAAGDDGDPRMVALGRDARRMYEHDLAPAFSARLAGGDFPEGWQYGDMVGALLALFADAGSRAGAAPAAFDELPWLRESVSFRAQALWPDGRHTLDTGDWSEKPAVAPAHAMLALSIVLPPSDDAARTARALAVRAQDPDDEWPWLVALADRPSAAQKDPPVAPLSYAARGTATLVARTDGSSAAVWFALASAPSISDHQHLDAGHFEVVRGDDALVVDAGGYGSYSSLSHNVLAVDDARENDAYAPSQGVWSDGAGLAREEDGGSFVYALAAYTSAYDPAGYPQDHPGRSVVRAEREVVFSRAPVPGLGAESARLVIYDRITLSKPTYRVTFLLHGGSDPVLSGRTTRFDAGHSAGFATTLLPTDAVLARVREPTAFGDGPYYANDPPEGKASARLEVRGAVGAVDRRFLHTIVVASRDAHPPVPARIEGDGVEGAVVADEAYLFVHAGPQTRAAPLSYRAPDVATRHILSSLAPNATYAVATSRQEDGACRVALSAGAGPAASSAGVLVLEVHDCVIRSGDATARGTAP